MLDGDNWLTDVPEAAQEELRSKDECKHYSNRCWKAAEVLAGYFRIRDEEAIYLQLNLSTRKRWIFGMYAKRLKSENGLKRTFVSKRILSLWFYLQRTY